jgi:hypothetical protein
MALTPERGSSAHPLALRLDQQRGSVAEAGVLDQDAARREWQHVQEAIPVELLDGRVHQHRRVEAVRPGQFELEAEELLPAQLEVPRVHVAAAVDDETARHRFAGREPHAIGSHLGDLDTTAHDEARQRREHVVQARRRDAVVSQVEAALQLREAHVL